MSSVHVLAVCWPNLPRPYPAMYKWEYTDTTGMAPTWLQRMWYISTSFARGTEEDRKVDNTFKVLLLNLASEKHYIQTAWRYSSRSSCGHVLYTLYIACFLSPACSNCQLYALGEGVVVMCSLHTYVAYQCAPFSSDRVHKMQWWHSRRWADEKVVSLLPSSIVACK